MASSVLSGVPAASVERYWPVVESLIAEALEHSSGRFRLVDVFAALIKQDMQLWVAGDEGGSVHVVAVTEVIDYPSIRIASIFLLAGRGREMWLHHLGTIESWAKDRDCKKLELRGRKGWERVLDDWTFKSITLEKDLRDG